MAKGGFTAPLLSRGNSTRCSKGGSSDELLQELPQAQQHPSSSKPAGSATVMRRRSGALTLCKQSSEAAAAEDTAAFAAAAAAATAGISRRTRSSLATPANAYKTSIEGEGVSSQERPSEGIQRKLLPGVPLQKQLAADGAWLLPSSKSLSGLIIGVVQEGAHVEAPPEDLVEVWRQRSPQCGEQATRGAGIVAEDTPRGAPLLRLPRALLLSTADAPAFIRDNCLLESSRPRQKQQKQLTPCSSEELLAVLLDDIKMAVSLVHARSVWDGEGHVAVSALDELQAYHWNSDWAIQHETSAEGLVWRAPRDIRRGENLFVNYGQYSNAHLLFHFGVELSGNPWGPAFFWRTDIGEIPYAALPNAVTSVSILRSAVSSSSALPLWLQGSAWAPKEGPCHPPLEGPSCAAPKLDFEEPRADRVFSAQAMSPDGQIGIICDQRVFTLRAFGRGAFVLSLFGAVGGVDATVYKCVRVLRFGEVTDALEREVLTSRLFHDACKQHHVQLSQADHVLKGGIAATENQLLLLQRTGPPAALEEASEELHRLKAMQRAARGNKLFTDKCIRYFSKIVSALHQKKRGARRRNTHRT
ncbi:transmembrane protein [Cyclospora cayetanensis]|uniref:Transmembrane protein n=1 Tax=Cyclospora cayetanensis TaxID=88456 RepID=A0A1D3D708_9EIME|nr:transmembrane protein [Cyclospora cayetanensis]